MLTFASGRPSIAPVIVVFSWRFPVLKNRISIKPSTSLSGDHHAYRWLGRVNWSHFLCNSTPILRHVINFSKMTATSWLLSFIIEILSTVSFLHMVNVDIVWKIIELQEFITNEIRYCCKSYALNPPSNAKAHVAHCRLSGGAFNDFYENTQE